MSYTPTTLHKYSYAANDPVNKTDPTGRETLIGLSFNISFRQALMVIAIPTVTALVLLEPPVRFYRYTSIYKINEAQVTGFVTGGFGVTWWTPDFYFTSQDAKSKLALPNLPEGWLSVLIYRTRDLMMGPHPVSQNFGELGGGTEYWTFKPIPFWSRMGQWGFF